MENRDLKEKPASVNGGLKNTNCEYSTLSSPFNQADREEDFRSAMSQAGIDQPPSKIIADGKFHSFHSTHKRKHNQDCRYVFHGTHGYFCDWSKGIEGEWSILHNPKVKLTFSERNIVQKHIEKTELYVRDYKTRIHNEVAQKAQKQWAKLGDKGYSNYLERKQVEAFGIRFGQNYIAIPLRDIDGEIYNLQKIFDKKRDGWDTDKVFMKEGLKKGCFHVLGTLRDGETFYVCEGYATAASIHMATGGIVVVAFDCYNLEPVVEALRQKYPANKIIVCADDDQWKPSIGNIGRKTADMVGKKYGCMVAYPKFQSVNTKPTDFNDLHCLEGVDVVKNQFEQALKTPVLKTFSLSAFLETKIPPREMILSPIIPQKGLIMLYAPRGVGKTYVALSIACAVAAGSHLFDDKWKAPKPVRVLFVDGEMPAFVLQERLSKISSSMGMPAHSFDNLEILASDLQENGIPDLSNREGQKLVEEHLDGVELLILDNLSALCRSGRENESESWQPMQELLLSLRRRGVSVLLIHHANKNGGQRGNSKKEDILDTVISLKKPLHHKPEDGALFEVHYEKARGFYGADAKPFEVHLQAKDDHLVWITADLEDAELEQILELHKQGLKQRDIAQKLGISAATVNRRLNQ